MPTPTITALKGEIARLEQALDRHRQALRLLEGAGPVPATRPAPAPAARPAPPPLRELILAYLKQQAPQRLAPSEVAQGLTQQGRPVSNDNVQRRLSELFKLKRITRKDGRYTLAT